MAFYYASAQVSPIITTIAGNGTPGYSGDGGSATAAQLNYPGTVAVDTTGNIYIGDCGNYVIRKVNTFGIIIAFAGNDTLGFSGDGGPATAAKIGPANAIVFDEKGNVYFTDGNKRVRKVDAAGIITTFAGNGLMAISGNGGPATAAGIGTGWGLCIDDTGNIYIGSNQVVRKVDTFGIIRAFAGKGTVGYTGDGGKADTASFTSISEIAFDIEGNMLIDDDGRIRKINKYGIISTVAGGTDTSFGDGGPATNASMTPWGVYPDKCGNFYIADLVNSRIRMVNDAGIINTIAGGDTAGYKGDGGPATAAELDYPETIYLDKHGSIYFADEYNHAVRYIHMDSCRNTLGVAAPGGATGGAVTVYPNPNAGTFTINVASPVSEDIAVSITDMMGRRVKELTMSSNKEQEVRLGMPAGVYFVVVKTVNGVLSQKVIISP